VLYAQTKITASFSESHQSTTIHGACIISPTCASPSYGSYHFTLAFTATPRQKLCFRVPAFFHWILSSCLNFHFFRNFNKANYNL